MGNRWFGALSVAGVWYEDIRGDEEDHHRNEIIAARRLRGIDE